MAGRASGSCGDFLASRIEQAAAADRREQQRERERKAEHRGPHVARGSRDGTPRAEYHRVECAAVLAERDLAVRAAIDVIEHDARQAAFGEPPQIGDVDDARGLEGSGHVSYWFAPAGAGRHLRLSSVEVSGLYSQPIQPAYPTRSIRSNSDG